MHPIESIMQVTMSELKKLIDVNTIVGDAVVTPDGSTIIPVSKVSLGFVSGGGEYGKPITSEGDARFSFAGGGGAGTTVSPIAFVVVKDCDVRLLCVNQSNVFESIIENIPGMISQMVKLFSDNSGKKDE